jgi:ribose transport system substrate-binding protein
MPDTEMLTGPPDISYGLRHAALRRALAVVMSVTAIFAGCKAHTFRTIAVIPETTATELWEAAHAGAERGGHELGFHVYWNAPTREDDVEKQIVLVERVVRNENAGLVLAPAQYLALVAPVREVLANHIPTVIIRSPLSISSVDGLSYVLNDDEETGRIAAMRIGLLLKGRGTVAVLGIDPNVTGIVVRAHSFASVLASEFPDISIAERRMGRPNSAEAQQVAEDILASTPKLDAIVGLNTAATQGALTALRVLGKSRKIRLVGCDQEIDLMAGVRGGDIDSIIAENTYEMGYRAVQVIAAQVRGETVPGETRLRPTLVTRANIDTPEVQRILSVDWRVSP